MDAADVTRWVEGYERAWRAPGTEALDELFTPDATYVVSPWREPIRGREALARFWESGRDGPDEAFTLVFQLVAVDPAAATAVVRAEVGYPEGDDRPPSRWRDLWVVRFAEDGRCAAFEEWPFAPGQHDGQEATW